MRRKVVFFSLIILFSIVLGIFVELYKNDNFLKVYFLDVGQGDSIFIEAPNGFQILVDAGGDRKVLEELNSIVNVFDRHINVLLLTNPDKDHMGGFVPILKRFDIDMFVEPGTKNDTETFFALKESVERENIKPIIANRGMKIVLDREKEIFLEILFPDRDVSQVSRNEGSIVAKLTFGNTSLLLQGDAPSSIEKYLIDLDSKKLDSDILKVGHHGSKTSTSDEYLKVVTPVYAVISSGKENTYGHPHKEVLKTLEENEVNILRTDTDGKIKFISDGNKWIKK